LRSALSTQGTPPNMVLIGLALFLTFFVMQPVLNDAWTAGILPLTEGRVGEMEGLRLTVEPFRKFMIANLRPADLQVFLDIAHLAPPATPDDTPWRALVPALPADDDILCAARQQQHPSFLALDQMQAAASVEHQHVLHQERASAGRPPREAAEPRRPPGEPDQPHDREQRGNGRQDRTRSDDHGTAFCRQRDVAQPDGAACADRARDSAAIASDSAMRSGRARRPSSGGRSSDLAHRRPMR
jgi:hypothetical protein